MPDKREQAFTDTCERWTARSIADIDFSVSLAPVADGPPLVLAVGDGRKSIPVAYATGQRLIDIASSSTMLARARANTAAAVVDLDPREGGMRGLAPAGRALRLVRICLRLPALRAPA